MSEASDTLPLSETSGCCGTVTTVAVERAAASPCCGTAAEARESASCCGATAKAEAVATHAGCCG